MSQICRWSEWCLPCFFVCLFASSQSLSMLERMRLWHHSGEWEFIGSLFDIQREQKPCSFQNNLWIWGPKCCWGWCRNQQADLPKVQDKYQSREKVSGLFYKSFKLTHYCDCIKEKTPSWNSLWLESKAHLINFLPSSLIYLAPPQL